MSNIGKEKGLCVDYWDSRNLFCARYALSGHLKTQNHSITERLRLERTSRYICSNTLGQAGIPKVVCPGPHLDGFWRSPRKGTPQPLRAACQRFALYSLLVFILWWFLGLCSGQRNHFRNFCTNENKWIIFLLEEVYYLSDKKKKKKRIQINMENKWN